MAPLTPQGQLALSGGRTNVRPLVTLPVSRTIQTTSRQAAVTFLGFESPNEGQETTFFETMQRLAGRLERVVFVDSAGGMELDT